MEGDCHTLGTVTPMLLLGLVPRVLESPGDALRHTVHGATTRWQDSATRTRSFLFREPRHLWLMFCQRLLEQDGSGRQDSSGWAAAWTAVLPPSGSETCFSDLAQAQVKD